MAFKFLAVFAVVITVASAQYTEYHHQDQQIHTPVYQSAPIHVSTPVYKHDEHDEHHAPAKYDFEYSVHDEHTGDIKSQKESREGDVVHGSYSLIDSDGHKRIVEYTADKHSGFNAVVHREPTEYKVPVPVQKVAAPVYHHNVAAPIVHAPVVHYSHHDASHSSNYHY